MLSYSEGEAVMARWPGTKLYYAATVAGLLPDTGEYEVRNVAGYSLVPQIDPSVPQLVVQSRRRPLLGPSPG